MVVREVRHAGIGEGPLALRTLVTAAAVLAADGPNARKRQLQGEIPAAPHHVGLSQAGIRPPHSHAAANCPVNHLLIARDEPGRRVRKRVRAEQTQRQFGDAVQVAPEHPLRQQ